MDTATNFFCGTLDDFIGDIEAPLDEEEILDILPDHTAVPVVDLNDDFTDVSSDIYSSNWSETGAAEASYWTTPEQDDQIKASTEQKFDGYAILGTSWNIVKSSKQL